jgi:hypothetical protein
MTETPIDKRLQLLEQDNRDLRQQLAKLQWRRRWLTCCVAVLLLIAVAAGAASFTGDHFELLHPVTSRERIAFYAMGKSTGLKFFDDSGIMRSFVGSSADDAPQIQLYAADGTTLRAALDLDTNSTPALKMYGANGKLRSSLFANSQGKSSLLNFFDEAGNVRYRLGMGDDSPGMSFWTPEGKIRASFYMNLQGKSEALQFFDDSGNIRLKVGVAEQDYLPVVQMFSVAGKLRIASQVLPQGDMAGLTFFDAAEKSRLFVGCDNNGEPIIRFLGADGNVTKELKP